jgi:hypothetical protein
VEQARLLRDAQCKHGAPVEQGFGMRRVSCRIQGSPEWRNGGRGGLKIRGRNEKQTMFMRVFENLDTIYGHKCPRPTVFCGQITFL